MEFKEAIVEFANKNGNYEYFQMEKFMAFQSSRLVTFTQVLNSINHTILILNTYRQKWITGLKNFKMTS